MGHASGGALHVDRVRPALHARAVARRAALRRAAARRDARVRLGRVPVHAVRVELEHERRAACRAFLIWGFWLVVVARVAAARSRALSGWTKFASLIVAPLWLTYPDRRAVAAVRRRASRSRRSPRSRSCCSSRARCTSCASSGTASFRWQVGRDAPWSLWDWGQYHARGIPDLHVVQRVLQALLVAGARRRRVRAAAQVAASARGADRRAPRRLRARAHVLALHVHPVVLRVRRDRAARAARGRGARAGSRARASTRSSSIPLARPSSEQSTTTPSIRTPPSAGSNRTGRRVRIRRIASSALTPITESCGPVMPASVIAAVPLRLDARVVRLHVRVRADHRGDATVEPARHRDLLARRLRVEVERRRPAPARARRRRARRRSPTATPACRG